MNRALNRRDFMGRSCALGGALAAGYFVHPAEAAESKSPNEKLNIAVFGIGGQGRSNLNSVRSQNIVALCDVDDRRAGNAYDNFPKARVAYPVFW